MGFQSQIYQQASKPQEVRPAYFLGEGLKIPYLLQTDSCDLRIIQKIREIHRPHALVLTPPILIFSLSHPPLSLRSSEYLHDFSVRRH